MRHVRNGRTVTLPAGYVCTATELGYASTVHTAQGVTADTVHGVVTGGGVPAAAVHHGDPRPHRQPHLRFGGRRRGPAHPHPARHDTALHRDRAARTNPWPETAVQDRPAPCWESNKPPPSGSANPSSATSTPCTSPPKTLIGSSAVQAVETSANRLLPGLSDEPAWPTLRGHLLLLAAAGADPVAELLTAAAQRDLTSAHDQAAVIDSRIQDVNQVTAGGPLPWLPGIPHRLAADPDWGPYLNARSQLVAELADQVRRNAAAEAPALDGPNPRSGAGRADRRPAGMARRHPGRPQRPATHRATPTRPRRPNLPTATRQATRRRGYQRRPAMAATTRHRSPQRHRGPIPARTRGKVDQPHPGRFRRHPPPAVGGRRRTATRRPPRRSPLVAHPRPATANAEPRTRNP